MLHDLLPIPCPISSTLAPCKRKDQHDDNNSAEPQATPETVAWADAIIAIQRQRLTSINELALLSGLEVDAFRTVIDGNEAPNEGIQRAPAAGLGVGHEALVADVASRVEHIACPAWCQHHSYGGDRVVIHRGDILRLAAPDPVEVELTQCLLADGTAYDHFGQPLIYLAETHYDLGSAETLARHLLALSSRACKAARA